MKKLTTLLARYFERFATRAVQRELRRVEKENLELQIDLQEAKSTIRIQSLELDELADVISRNRQRVQAETAIEARRMVDAERGNEA